nr:secondary thiamine-phosphate synthase enzyme YjbQ [Desulfobaculum xiamenense]
MTIVTHMREELVNVTSALNERIRERGWDNGAVVLWCPHTTGALTVNEAADPDVARDIVVGMRGLVPHRGDYRHAEGNSDAHIKTSLFGPGLTLIVDGGRLQLGTWQGVYFCEFDGPRTRSLWMQWLQG